MRTYKLLIVDDEVEVRKGIINKIDWQGCGFEIVAEAENGKEALELFEKTLPDVVLTDIKMPFMNGLELAKAIRDKYPTTKIIVMTGFDEFEYAHKAIKLNVVEYLLRPVSAQEMTDILLKVKRQIDEEIAEKENVQNLREYYRKSIPILREKFLTSLVSSALPKEEILERAKTYNIDLQGNDFVASVISVDNIKDRSEEEISSTSSEAYSDSNEERELQRFSVLNIVEEVIGRYGSGTAFINNENVVVLMNCIECGREALTAQIFNVLEEIRQTVDKFLDVTVTIGVGSVYSDISLISRSYQNAVAALDYRIFMGSNRIIWIEDIEPKSATRIVFDEVKERNLASALKVGTEEEISKTIDDLFEKLLDLKVSHKDYQIYVMEILTTILKAARSSDVDIDSLFGNNNNLFSELHKHKSIEEVKGWFKNISIKIMNYIVKDRQDTAQLMVEKAKEYVKDNYSDSEITINKVCDYLHISPTYFSFIFKRETKTTFINYLTQLRMDISKELLRTTNMKTLEVAEKVGYAESNYFSYSFKKKFGFSPSEYRNSFKQNT